MVLALTALAVVFGAASVLLFLENRHLRGALGDALTANRRAIVERDAAIRNRRGNELITRATRNLFQELEHGTRP